MAIMHERIKELRNRRGYTLSMIADYLDVTEATAQRYETGKGIKTIPYDVIEKYANIFNCSPAYLMGWENDSIEKTAQQHSESLDDISSVDNAITDQEVSLKVERQKQWESIMGDVIFTEEELQQIIDYAKYIVSKRKDG